MQGGLGVCVVMAGAAVGTVGTVMMRSAPGPLLGFAVVAGTVIAALAIRPRAGRMIVPAPALSYLVAALVSGIIYNRSGTSRTALAVGAVQWIANGFFAMTLGTVLAGGIAGIRWYMWRRGRRGARDGGWPSRADTARSGPGRGTPPASGYLRGPGNRGSGGQAGGWGDLGRGAVPRHGPPPGSGPYNLSSGA